MGSFINFLKNLISGISGSYAFSFLGRAFVRLRTAVMNPFRRVVRRIQQIFNVNMITAKLAGPINAKVRKILGGEAKSPEDYFTVGRFWISKALVYILVLAICAFVFIYFNWIAPPVSDSIKTESRITSVYYDYDDMKLGEYDGKANIRAANGEVVYTGDIIKGVCTGSGTLWNQDGVLIYEGDFVNNCFEGNGTRYYPSGKALYTGEFAENQYSGRGTLYYPDGTIQYEGDFENGNFQGKGAEYNEKGIMIYEGEFFSGIHHGTGTSYYNSGIKKYEGDFYMGKAQGIGTSFTAAGKPIFEGAFARDAIHYESLLGASLKDVSEMFKEEPKVYFDDGATSMLYESAKIVLKLDCLVELMDRTEDTSDGNDWYLENSADDLLPETESSQLAEENSEEEKDAETIEAETLASLPVQNIYGIYYYLMSDEWQNVENLDLSGIHVTAVSVYWPEISVGFLEGETMIPENGSVALMECIAIENVRMEQPTAFSNINYEMLTKNNTYTQVRGVNMANAIYKEVYDVEGVRYKLCYEMDQPNDLKFVTAEIY